MKETHPLRLESVRKVFGDDNHNAFTDLRRFGGKLYLTFRSCPDGHGIANTAKVRVLSSADGAQWRQVFEFSVPDRDTRDPHFLVFKDALFVYTGTWLCPAGHKAFDINDHLGYAAWSRDGAAWNGPKSLEGTYGHYVWRAAAHGGRAYLCGRRKRDFAPLPRPEGGDITESALLESEDGLVWRFRGRFQEEFGDETAFLFEDDGSILAVARTLGGRPAQVCRSRPPYAEWTRSDLSRYVGGPLLVKWGERYLVGGRRMLKGEPPRTVLYWLVDDQLQEALVLPSGGDNSYPGFSDMGGGRALVSYYSCHECPPDRPDRACIYLAEVAVD
ncbi:MAG: hypothetical protein AB1696_26755 [Planctomycetota bacterium]